MEGEDGKKKIFVLNLHHSVPQRDVVRKILSYLNEVDIEMVMTAHNRAREKTLKKEFCNYCAKFGYTKLMIWAHEQGYEWNVDTANQAAEGGHIVCFYYFLFFLR